MDGENRPNIAEAGSDWTAEEVAAVVADYFAMLADETAGRPYNKREHSRGLQAVTGRSAGSIEFKHQNISAVLAELGLPWLRGYKPRYNYQDALIAEVEQHLARVPVEIDSPSEFAPVAATTADVFVPPPNDAPAAPTGSSTALCGSSIPANAINGTGR